MQKVLIKLMATLISLANKVLYRVIGGSKRAVWYDIEKTNRGLLRIDENYEAIREEILKVLPKQQEIPDYYKVDEAQYELSMQSKGDGKGHWRTLFLYLQGHDLPTKKLLPKTLEIIEGIPNCIQAWISIMEGGQSVAPHRTRSYGYLRYHLGVVVPTDKPPRIRVKDGSHTWQEGKSVLFDNSWEHEVINESKQNRVVLIVDVLRPLPWVAQFFNRLTFRVIYSKLFTRKAVANIQDTVERMA